MNQPDETAALERIARMDGYEILFDPALCASRLREAAAIARALLKGRRLDSAGEAKPASACRTT